MITTSLTLDADPYALEGWEGELRKMSDLNPCFWSVRLRALLVISLLTGSSLGALVGMEAAELTEQQSLVWNDAAPQDLQWTQLRGVGRPVPSTGAIRYAEIP